MEALARSAVACGVLSVLLGACSPERAADAPELRGERVEVLGVWEGIEAERFASVVAPLERRTGVDVVYTSTEGVDIATALDRRIASGDAPALAFLPQPGLLRQYAHSGHLVALGGIVGDEVGASWSRRWRQLGTVDGRLFALWFKAAHKSLVWYDIASFERAGVVPPADAADFQAVADALLASGVTPFAVSGADEWTLTDWFENLYLRFAGPARYDALAERRLPWNDPSVQETLRTMGRLLSPPLATGGPSGMLETTFTESVELVFGSSPQAAMVVEGDFVAAAITDATDARIGVEADVFPFPDVHPRRRLVIGGGDALVLLRRTAAAEELLRHLATARAAETWAAAGGFISPNEEVDLATYPDEISRAIARSLIEAGDGFRFDLSDAQPIAFGGTPGRGMSGILRELLEGPQDAVAMSDRLEAAARAAYAEDAGVTE